MLFYLLLMFLNFFSRRIFLETLGADLIGLATTTQSYIGMLNLADLGITGAIAALLYAPLFNNDRQKITEIISIYGYLFRMVGIAIGIGGVILSLFLPLIFAKDPVPMWGVYLAFYTFLTTTLLSYTVNYKQNLLVANQKNYVVITILNTTNILKTIIQIVLLKWGGCGFTVWLAIELLSAVAFAVWLERRINREYPWLRTEVRKGRQLLRQYPEVTLNIKRVFSHKIAGYVMQQSDPLVVQLIMGVSMVTYYSNYTTITSRAIQLLIGSFSSNFAGVGNLVAEGDRAKIKLVFWQMNAMYYWLGGVSAYCFYLFINNLIPLWLSEGYILFEPIVVALIALNLYIYIVRQPLQYFVSGYALFGDTAAAWIEASINLAISITFGILYGIIGVVAGTAISTLLVVLVWRPHYLYTRGFGESSGMEYWITIIKYGALLALSWIVCDSINSYLPTADNWINLLVNGVIMLSLISTIYGGLMWLSSSGMRTFVRLVLSLRPGWLKFK